MARLRLKKMSHRLKAIEMGTQRAWNSCWRKRKFTELEAEVVGEKWKQRPYECEICGCWHLTKNVGSDNGSL